MPRFLIHFSTFSTFRKSGAKDNKSTFRKSGAKNINKKKAKDNINSLL